MSLVSLNVPKNLLPIDPTLLPTGSKDTCGRDGIAGIEKDAGTAKAGDLGEVLLPAEAFPPNSASKERWDANRGAAAGGLAWGEEEDW